MSEQKPYRSVFLLQITVFVILLVGGLLSGSITLLGDTVHVGIDALAQAIGWFASALAIRDRSIERSVKIKMTGVMVSGMLLIMLGLPLLISAVLRLIEPRPIHGEIALFTAIAGLTANYLGLRMYGTSAGDELLQVSRAHIKLDAVATIAALASAALTTFTEILWWDPVLGLILSFVFIVGGTYYILTARHRLAQIRAVETEEDDRAS